MDITKAEMDILVKEYDVRRNGNILISRFVNDVSMNIGKLKGKDQELTDILKQMY